ncbi:MAG: sodium:calcium antiporter [Phycisphaerales bacterium]|nr:MAG: sodium:calcium antiporter [Phycisphaerales bacterium]
MLVPILQVAAGFVLLAMGAEGLVRGAASLALRLGVSSLVVGLTIVAFGTSSPELIVSVRAALAGNEGIAVGNVVGSNIFNIGVILAIAALLCPIVFDKGLARRETPVMLGVALLVPALALLGGHVAATEADPAHWVVGRWAGLACVVLGVAYTLYAYRMARRGGPVAIAQYEADVGGGETAAQARRRPVWLDISFVIAGTLVLVIGSRLLVDGATVLARTFGVSELVIGLTIVSAGTSLPELATSVVAALRKEPDICVGNVIGSNIYNVLFIMGAAALASPLSFEAAVMFRDVPAMLVMSVLCVVVLWTGSRITRWEGAALLAVFLAYMALLITQARGAGA